MSYVEFAPPTGLHDEIECLWIRRGGSEVHVLPDGCVDVVWQAGIGATVAGPDTAARVVAAGSDDLFMGVRFLPGAGGSALGVPLDELRNLQPTLAELLPSLRRELPPSLPPSEALRRLTALAGRLVDVGRPDPLVRRAAARLADPHLDVNALAAELALGDRQLRRRFHAAVGYGPKTLQRVLRFRRFLRHVDRGEDLDLAAIAIEAGYADQAHLTRESTRLAGLPPAALALKRSPRRP